MNLMKIQKHSKCRSFNIFSNFYLSGLDFGNMEDSNRICHENIQFGTDEPSMMLRDLDGTLTGTPGLSVTADVPYYHDGMECEIKSEWNMTLCQGKLARVKLYLPLIVQAKRI